MIRRRLAAAASLVLLLAVIALSIIGAIGGFPHGVSVLACLLIALLSALNAALRRGPARLVGFAVAGLAATGAVALVLLEGDLVVDLVVVAGFALSLACARAALAVHVSLPSAQAPGRPVLFFNPLSGGGKAVEFNLAEEARARGIEPIELRRGDDLRTLVADAVNRGADGLAMAGGDGSQAIVAEIASERDLPYACIPAGTRNHFALDLGVDRDDLVGALDAFVDGGERRVDLGEVNGRTFVNNVSLGVYADAVQHAGYREAKLRTLLATLPDTLGGESSNDLRWRGSSGREQHSRAMILVSNNHYRLGRVVGTGTRPRLDDGILEITVLTDPQRRRRGALWLRPGWRQWPSKQFRVDAENPIPAGIDGEAVTLAPPLRFRSHEEALRVRIARNHPGASPAAGLPSGPWDAIRWLVTIAVAKPARANRHP
jgi:diacylglycerol kinase family enzyme